LLVANRMAKPSRLDAAGLASGSWSNLSALVICYSFHGAGLVVAIIANVGNWRSQSLFKTAHTAVIVLSWRISPK
jgi:hypothetical protein